MTMVYTFQRCLQRLGSISANFFYKFSVSLMRKGKCLWIFFVILHPNSKSIVLCTQFCGLIVSKSLDTLKMLTFKMFGCFLLNDHIAQSCCFFKKKVSNIYYVGVEKGILTYK